MRAGMTQAERGMATKIIVDNGPEFLSRIVDQWAYENGVEFHFIGPGKPTQNACIESFNGKFRDECLNQNWCLSLSDARRISEEWRVDYNTARHTAHWDIRRPLSSRRLASPPTPFFSRWQRSNDVVTGQASDNRETFEFTIEPYVSGGFMLSIRDRGDGSSNITGAGVWPTVEKAKQIAEETAQRLLHGATVTWQANTN